MVCCSVLFVSVVFTVTFPYHSSMLDRNVRDTILCRGGVEYGAAAEFVSTVWLVVCSIL